MASQLNISPNTPMGATLINGGSATFRAWAPLATAVYINGTFGGSPGGSVMTGQSASLLLAKDANGYWTGAGSWREVFDSDVDDNWVNPVVAGNGGGIDASGPPRHGFPASASIVIPANGFVVFARTSARKANGAMESLC
jgi:hypothetical protein